jgi:hypothetical protein
MAKLRPQNATPKWDGITPQGIDIQEERDEMYYAARGICASCSEPISYSAFEIAHKIANTLANRKRYGNAVIDSRHNKAVTHRGSCNSRQNCGNNPGLCAEIVKKVEGES